MARICVVGAGYVGLVTAACFAEMGHQVKCLDIDHKKIRLLERNHLPFYEPGLQELLIQHCASSRLEFTTDYRWGIRDNEFIFLAVNTPTSHSGRPDLKNLFQAAQDIGKELDSHIVVVLKSTVPVGTTEEVGELISRVKKGNSLEMVVNPEFLREGSAIQDFLHPSRVVLGSHSRQAALAVARLFQDLGCPIIFTDPRTAEMIKYAANAFLATKISFINEMAAICEKVGADVLEVARGIGLDPRIGPAYLRAGLGWGGSCLPKDVRGLCYIASSHGVRPSLLRGVAEVNYCQRRAVIEKLRRLLGALPQQTIGLLGLAFKPGSSDMREAPSLDLIHYLLKEGCHIKAYDPKAMEETARITPHVVLCRDPYEVALGSDALVLVTEWEEFRELDMRKVRSLMRQPYFVDGRNMFDPGAMARLGFVYEGIGRGRLGLCDREALPAVAATASQE